MVDGGAALNIMTYATYQKLGKTREDLIKTNMVLKDFLNGRGQMLKGF